MLSFANFWATGPRPLALHSASCTSNRAEPLVVRPIKAGHRPAAANSICRQGAAAARGARRRGGASALPDQRQREGLSRNAAAAAKGTIFGGHCGTRQQPARSPYPARFRWKMRKNGYGILSYHCHIPIKHCRTYSFIRRAERIDAAVAQSPVKRCQAPSIAMRYSDRPLKYCWSPWSH